MCGIAGIFDLQGRALVDDGLIEKMTAHLVHRGPDDEGFHRDGPLVFGFRRLKIIDLATGHQPLTNEDGSVWVMLNGEIYNYVELRERLVGMGHVFRTRSDTEVIVHAYESYGLDFVHHLRGMFAIALWDSRRRRLVLARDRMGKKPLYYAAHDGLLAFASEFKALLSWEALPREVDPKALHDYFSFLCVPGPRSILQSVAKLLPGHLLVAEAGTDALRLSRYWRVNPAPEEGRSMEYYCSGLRERLEEAVRLRLRSDVSLGAFLSGGIDSSIIVGLMARQMPGVKTFSIGFREKGFDETEYAREAAQRFHTEHTTAEMDATTMRPDDLGKLVRFMDEPFADSSFIPTYWLSQLTRRQTTVALSGDGGDELFGGYLHYRNFLLLQRMQCLPVSLRRGGACSLKIMRSLVQGLLGNSNQSLRRWQKALEWSALGNEEQMLSLVTYFDEEEKIRLYRPDWAERVSGYRSTLGLSDGRNVFSGLPPVDQFMARSLEAGLVDDILTKVDRASMACSLEVRCPFLDQEVVEFAMNIPAKYKMQGTQLKVTLKAAFQDLLPTSILRRGKKGFEVPLSDWFQDKEWRNLMLDLLSPARLHRQGIFAVDEVLKMRDQFLDNPNAAKMEISAYQLRHRVWMLLMFQMWLDNVYSDKASRV